QPVKTTLSNLVKAEGHSELFLMSVFYDQLPEIVSLVLLREHWMEDLTFLTVTKGLLVSRREGVVSYICHYLAAAKRASLDSQNGILHISAITSTEDAKSQSRQTTTQVSIPLGLQALYKEMQAAICVDPTVKKTEKTAPKAHKIE
ncbi:hypothetical protein MKW98_028547, partial [Papaver atlanticum]